MTTDPDAAKRLLGELGAEVQAALAEIRRLVDGLRPPALDELGLVGAIEQQAARLEGSTGAGTGHHDHRSRRRRRRCPSCRPPSRSRPIGSPSRR